MKTFNNAIARVRNDKGEFVVLSAIRGLDSYQLAKEAGFEGTEEEWMNSIIGDGWVGAYQQLETEQENIKAKQTEIETAYSDVVESQATIENRIDDLEKDVDGITPYSIGAASLENDKVKPEQSSSAIKEIADSSYTLVAEDAGKMLMFNFSGDVTATIPADIDCELFPVGTEIEMLVGSINVTSLSVTTSDAENVKFMSSGGPEMASVSADTSISYSVVILKRIYNNRWLAKGEVT